MDIIVKEKLKMQNEKSEEKGEASSLTLAFYIIKFSINFAVSRALKGRAPADRRLVRKAPGKFWRISGAIDGLSRKACRL